MDFINEYERIRDIADAHIPKEHCEESKKILAECQELSKDRWKKQKKETDEQIVEMLNQGYRTFDIEMQFGCTKCKLVNAARRLGVEVHIEKDNVYSVELLGKVLELYNKGLSPESMMKELSLSSNNLDYYLSFLISLIKKDKGISDKKDKPQRMTRGTKPVVHLTIKDIYRFIYLLERNHSVENISCIMNMARSKVNKVKRELLEKGVCVTKGVIRYSEEWDEEFIESLPNKYILEDDNGVFEEEWTFDYLEKYKANKLKLSELSNSKKSEIIQRLRMGYGSLKISMDLKVDEDIVEMIKDELKRLKVKL